MTAAKAFALFLLCTWVMPAWAGTGDGTVIGATKIVDSGPDDRRFNVVIVSDGYRQGELGSFAEQARQAADALLSTLPVDRACAGINVWRVDVASTESGADDPRTCGDGSSGSGASPRTYFDSTFCFAGQVRRLLFGDTAIVQQVLNAQVPGWKQAIVLVNSQQFGGGGQAGGPGGMGFAWTSLTGDWRPTLRHELGHGMFGLADEYEDLGRCPGTAQYAHHPPPEPLEPNATLVADPTALKWRALVFPGTPLPTREVPSGQCDVCDLRDPFPGATVVGMHEGADHYHCDAYRPVHDCLMRTLSRPFCPVCDQAIRAVLATYQPAHCAICTFDTDGDGTPELSLRDDDGDGYCEWPMAKTDLHGTLRFRSGMQVEFTGNTVVEADAIVVEEGASLRGDGLRTLTMLARTGGIQSAGAVDLHGTDDLTFTARRGPIDLGGPTRLVAGDRLALDARSGDLVLHPPFRDETGEFPFFAGNRAELTARGSVGGIRVAKAIVGSRRILVNAGANLSVVTGKTVTLTEGTALITDRLQTHLQGASDVTIRAETQVRIGQGARVDSGHNVAIAVRRGGAELCLAEGPVLEAQDAAGRRGFLDLGGVRGPVYDDGSAQLLGIVKGKEILIGSCP